MKDIPKKRGLFGENSNVPLVSSTEQVVHFKDNVGTTLDEVINDIDTSKVGEVYMSDGKSLTPMTTTDEDGKKITILPKDQFGKVADVKLNGASILNSENVANINIAASVSNTTGTPAVTPVVNGGNVALNFSGIKGEPGEGAIWTGEGEEIMALAQETGQAINKSMSQKAVTDELDAIGNDIYDYEEDGETDTDLSDLIEVGSEGKIVIVPGGSLNTSTGQDASNYIDIGEYDAITYPRNSSAGASVTWGIAFYDENQESKSQAGWYEKAIANAGDATDYVAKRIDVPEGAKYVRLSLRKTGFSAPTLTGHKKTYTKTPKIERVEEEISGVSTNVEAIEGEVYDYEKSGSEEVADLSSLITHNSVGYNVLTTGSLSGGSSVNDATDYIDIGDYDAIRYSRNSRSSTASIGIAFYNSGKTRVGGQVALSNASATDYVLTDIDLPEGTKYVRMTIRKEAQGWSTPVLKGLRNTYTKSSKIAAIEQKIENVGKGIFPPLIGVPQPYIFTPTEDVGISNFAHVADLHAAYDALCEQYPKWLHKEENIGTDATETYEVRHYTLRYQTPLISINRSGSGTNYWSDEDMPMRRILLMTGIHAMEQFSTRGTYLAVKAICESDEPWAKFIKANAIIDIIPIINPWGLENNSNYNSNSVNLNRDYKSATPQVETQNVINLIQSLLPLNLGGIVDMHNTGEGDTYLVSNTAYKEYTYYARLAQQLSVIVDAPLQSAFGSGIHMHCWITEETGQGHWYADQCGILGATFEVKAAANFYGRSSCLTAMQAVNAIIAFLQKMN